jgi:hypothetical protein
MKISETKLRRIIRENLLNELDITAGMGSGGGAGSGEKGPDENEEYCCSKWYNLSKDYPDQVPSDWAGIGDYWVDRCWNPRGEPVYDSDGTHLYSCTASRGQGSLTGRLSDFAKEAMDPTTDTNTLMAFVDLTGITQIPHVPIALDTFEEDESIFNAAMLTLAVLAIIPVAGKLAKLGSATLRRLASALKKVSPGSNIPSSQLNKAVAEVNKAISKSNRSGAGDIFNPNLDKEEFDVLTRMHNIIPSNSPKPGQIRTLAGETDRYGLEGFVYTMEKVGSISLDDLFKSGKLTPRKWKNIKSQIDDLIKNKLHKANPPFYHSDLHPGNVMIDSGSGRVYIIDPRHHWPRSAEIDLGQLKTLDQLAKNAY